MVTDLALDFSVRLRVLRVHHSHFVDTRARVKLKPIRMIERGGGKVVIQAPTLMAVTGIGIGTGIVIIVRVSHKMTVVRVSYLLFLFLLLSFLLFGLLPLSLSLLLLLLPLVSSIPLHLNPLLLPFRRELPLHPTITRRAKLQTLPVIRVSIRNGVAMVQWGFVGVSVG